MKRILSIFISIAILCTVIPPVAFATANAYYEDFSSQTPNGWTLNGAVAEGGALKIPADSAKTHTLKLSKPYPTGTVVVEYDFNSESERRKYLQASAQ